MVGLSRPLSVKACLDTLDRESATTAVGGCSGKPVRNLLFLCLLPHLGCGLPVCGRLDVVVDGASLKRNDDE